MKAACVAQGADPYSIPLDKIDISDKSLHQRDLAGAYLKRLREEDPVHYCADGAYGPFWSVTKFDDIMYVEKAHNIFSSAGAVVLDDLHATGGPGEGGVPIDSFLAMDPPRHDEQRKIVTPAVAPANLAVLAGAIRERTCNVLDSLPLNEPFDWVERVSIELTTQMLATLLDFPFEQRGKLSRWTDVAVSVPGDGVIDTWDDRTRELLECAEFITALYQQRKHLPAKPDLLSMLAHSPLTDAMPPMEFLANILLLIIGGNDTTRNSMSGSILAFNENPAELAKLKANPKLIESAVPEIIRWQTPVIYMARRAACDTELRGKKIRKGDKVAMWYLSGNRDEDAIEHADQFIVDRARPRHHLSFGFGIHRCLGNRLAEMQLRILWEEILTRFDRIEVVGPCERIYSHQLRGISALPVVLHSARGNHA